MTGILSNKPQDGSAADSARRGGFYLVELPNGWRVGRFAALDGTAGVTAVVTTRQGLDVDVVKNDYPSAAGLLAECLHLKAVAWCRQVHGSEVLPVSAAGSAGRCDGMVTSVGGLGLMVRSADCPLILAVDASAGAVGVAHASWRATGGRIAGKLVAALADHCGARPDRLAACICPSAGPCCYQVGDDLLAAMSAGLGPAADRFVVSHDGKTCFDLWSANRAQLLDAGLAGHNIHVAGLCTICNNDLFPSYRAEGQSAGRFAAVIAYAPPDRQ